MAVAVCAWLAVSLRNEIRIDNAADVQLSAKPTDEQLDAAIADADDSRALNPDWAEPDGLIAAINIRRMRPRRAFDALREIVRREPDNVQAWALLSLVSRQFDPALATRAAERVRELDPVNARRRQ